MRVLKGAFADWPPLEGTACAVGVFDGVHRGHQHVLEVVASTAANEGLIPAVLTFDPHPLAVVAPEAMPPMLTTIEQRIDLFGAAGIGATAVLGFTEDVRAMTAEAFIVEILVERLGVRVVVAGNDFRFGDGRTGDMTLMTELGLAHDYRTVVTDLVGEGEAISSTRIRQAIAAGDLGAAAHLLGRPVTIAVESTAEPDDRDLTSVSVPDGLAVPAPGVYAVGIGGEVGIAFVDPSRILITMVPAPGIVELEFAARLRDGGFDPARVAEDAAAAAGYGPGG